MELFTVHYWWIKHAVQSVTHIDISEPARDLLYLHLLVFGVCVLFDQARLLSILYILWKPWWLAFPFGNPLLRWLFVLHSDLMIRVHRRGIILVNSPNTKRFILLTSEQEMAGVLHAHACVNSWENWIQHRYRMAFLITKAYENSFLGILQNPERKQGCWYTAGKHLGKRYNCSLHTQPSGLEVRTLH